MSDDGRDVFRRGGPPLRPPGAVARLRRCAALVLAPLLAASCLGADGHKIFWGGAWTASVQAPATGQLPTWALSGFRDQTVRQVVRLTAGGESMRVRLSDKYGAVPLRITGATVAVAGTGASVRPKSTRWLRFDRSRSVVIGAGREVVSDPVPFHAVALESLTVTLYLTGPTGPATFHREGHATSFRAAGDHLADEAATAFTETTRSWYYLSAVEVATSTAPPKAIVAFGDSITDGHASALDANDRYPDELAERLAAAGRPRAVLNAGLGGNLMLHDSVWYGESATARFEHDVLDRPRVGTVILLEGINDLGFSEARKPTFEPHPEISADQLITAYRGLVARAHAKGIKVIGGTLTPMGGSDHYSARSEAKRETINRWIRTSGTYDAVADFDNALADPAHPRRLAQPYDSGDHLHPNDGGYHAMAEVAGLTMLLD